MTSRCCIFVLFLFKDEAEGEVRLVDGPTANEGRVEIFHNGQCGEQYVITIGVTLMRG